MLHHRNNPFRVLAAHRNFRLFWFGQTLSLVGTWMQQMAQGWLALQLSNNAFLVGLVGSVGSLPIVLFSLYAGVVADRADKLRIVVIMQSLLLLEAALLWWFTWSDSITIGWLLLLAAGNGMFSAFEIPARQSLIVELVGRDDLPSAIALNSSGFNLARIIGPSLAAAIIATAGLSWCFGVNALSYLAVLVGLLMIRLPQWTPEGAVDTSSLAGLLEGLRYMRRTPEVWALMRLVTVFSICGIPYLTLMPVVVRDRLGLGASGYGVLLACVGAGGLAGALFLAAAGTRIRRGCLLEYSAYAFAVLLVAFAFTTSPLVAGVLLLMTGFAMILNNALANALLQSLVHDAFRGRLMAAYSLVVVGLSQVIGAFAAGAVARAVGVQWAIAGGAAIMLGYAAVTHIRAPFLRVL